MKRFIGLLLAVAALIALLGLWAPARAQNVNTNCLNPGGTGISAWRPCTNADAPYATTPLTPDQHGLAITSSTALTVPSGASQAVVCVSGSNVNYTYDGTTTPTATVGMPLLVAQCILFTGPTMLSNLRFIQQTATATLDVAYSK